MSSPRLSDVELLEKLLLGQASAAEIEQLAQQYADDSRLAELAETVVNRGDTLLEALRGLRPIDDAEADRLVERLLQRLPSSLATLTHAAEDTGSGSVAGSSAAAIPENLEYFLVQKVLGEGGMGTVYLAYDTRLRREVAVKTLKPSLAQKTEAKERFLREDRTAAALEHDHIIPIYYVGEADGIPFLVMALLKGASLDDLLKQRQGARETGLPVPQALRIARQIAIGLAAAHARGLVHRDIKPSNVWLETSPDQEFGEFRVKLLDFGLARSGEDDLQLTASGVILGTPAYMAPEQARGESVDHRCDLFSLGVVLYRMVTGRLPFSGNTILAVLTSLVMDHPVSPQLVNSELPPELSDLIMQLLTKDPAGRPASAKEVAERLGQIERRLSVSTPVSDPTGPDLTEARSVDSTQVSRAGSELAVTECLARHAPLVTRPEPHRNKRRTLIAAAVALLILGPLGWLFHGTIIRLVTNQGELVIDVRDPSVDVRVELNGAVVRDKTSQRQFTLTAGKGEIEVMEKDGIKLATKKFELTRGGTTTVTVTLQELADARKTRQEPHAVPDKTSDKSSPEPGPAATPEPDRRAVEYALSIGVSKIKIRTQEAEGFIDPGLGLPKEPFQLTSVDLNGNQQVTESGLASFKGCRNLTSLYLAGSRVTDAGLVNFKDCKNLTVLALGGTPVSDAGLTNFKDCQNLTVLNLGFTQVTDAGLANFKNCKNLTVLELAGMTDAGLANFKDCRNLTVLNLGITHATDSGLANFKDCKKLTTLTVVGRQVTDAGVAHFKGCTDLTNLDLSSVLLTEAGLASFKDCKNLTHVHLADTPLGDANLDDLARFASVGRLNLGRTRISLAGYEQLQGLIPRCEIIWSEMNRTVAEEVLGVGGSLEIGRPGESESRLVMAVADLPRDYFQVRKVSLTNVEIPLDRLCEQLSTLRFADLDRVESIDFSGTSISYLSFLTPVRGLEQLRLVKSGIRGDWLAALPKLKRLAVDDNPIGGLGLANLDNQSELTELTLAATGLTDGDLFRLPILPKLERLVLDGNEIRGLGLPALKRQPALTDLSLGCPALTDSLAKNLAELKQLKRLSLAGSGITDASLAHAAGLTGLEALDLRRTKVTAAGLAALAKALPACKIESGSASTPDVDRRAAEYVLSIGAKIKIRAQEAERGVDAVAGLPKEPFQLTSVYVDSNQHVTESGLANFKGCQNLTSLYLYNSGVTEAGLAHFKDCRNLTVLNLCRSPVTDAGLASFKDCQNLTVLELVDTQVTDTGLANFKNCRNLTALSLAGTQVTDAGLVHFKGCQNLTSLNLDASRVTDAGLANLKACQNLTELHLGGTSVTDAGLVNFKDCGLTVLALNGTAVTDTGLAQFKNLKNLEVLGLAGMQVTDAGLANFKDCRNLTGLNLGVTRVTNAGLANFKDCRNLTALDLRQTAVTDAGLANFKDCKNLEHLSLVQTQVSDASLADLGQFDGMQRLNLDETRISLAGYEELKSIMSRCEITWSEMNRTVAEGVLALGSVEIGRPGDNESRPVKAVADFPRDYFQVRKASLTNVEKPLDNLPEQLSRLRFPDLDRVESIDFSGTPLSHLGFLIPIQGLEHLALGKCGIRGEWLAALSKLKLKRLALDDNPIGGAGLEHLANQSELTELTLATAGLTDSDLRRLPVLPKLARLVLDGNEIRGSGMPSLKRQPALIELSLACPTLTDLLARNLAELKQIKRLSLAGSGITDAGLAHLASLTGLEALDVRKTKVTTAGLAALAKALPACKIESDLNRDSK